MKIGELASATATKVETVRYYEKIGLLPPPAPTIVPMVMNIWRACHSSAAPAISASHSKRCANCSRCRMTRPNPAMRLMESRASTSPRSIVRSPI